jgi:hypothetical protein
MMGQRLPLALAGRVVRIHLLNWGFALERVTGNEPALSAWELNVVAARLPADRLTSAATVPLTVRDRDCPRWLLRSGR